jgi:hypothetical protein
MTRSNPGSLRVRNQLIGSGTPRTPRDVVSHLCAIQAQDYLGALWAVGLRMRDASELALETALADRTIIRTWPLRGTLHFVAAEDARWMLELLAPGVIARNAGRQERENGVTEAVLKRARTAVRRGLTGGSLTRNALYEMLQKSRVTVSGLQLVWRLAHEGLICFGPRQGKQQTFVLLDEWLPASPAKPREAALAELARRYFHGHAPATVADFAWWSGLPAADARKAIMLAQPDVEQREPSPHSDKSIHLLPPFDEFVVGYKDRSDVIDPAFARKVNNGGGMLQAVVIADGRVVGTWKRTLKPSAVDIDISAFRSFQRKETTALNAACDRYATFLGLKVGSFRVGD